MTNPFLLHHRKIFYRGTSKKGMKWYEQGKIGHRHCSALAGNTLYKRETK
jgi:hypothetical protein